MASSTQPTALVRALDRAVLVLAAVAGVSLVFMVVVIAAGVVTRYLFGQPILGLNEIVQLVSVAVVMLALPYCTQTEGHVRVDVFDEAIGRAGRFLGNVQSRLLSAFVLGVLIWRAGLKTLDAHAYADTTNMLNLPIWPLYAMLAVGMALCVLVLLAQTVLLVVGREP